MPTPQASENFFTTLHERIDNRFTRITAATAIALGSLTLAACGNEATPNTSPSPSATVEHETLAQYIDTFTQYKDPAELQLAAGATPDQFGKWVTDLSTKWSFASCDKARDIIKASIALGITDDQNDFYPKIAAANANVLSIAMYGKNPGAAAEGFRTAAIKNNAETINACVAGAESKAEHEDYVSTKMGDKDDQGNQIYDVTVNVVPGSYDSVDQPGLRTYAY